MKDSELTALAATVDQALRDADLRVVVKTGTGSDWGVVSDSYLAQVEVMVSALLRAGLLRFDDRAELERLRAVDAAARKYVAGGLFDEFMAALGIPGYEADAAPAARTPQPAEPTVRDDLARNVAQLWRRDRAAADGQPMLVGRTYQGELWTALNQLAAAYVDAGAPQPAVPDGPRLDELHRALARRIGNLRRGSRKLLEISSARNAKHVALLDERDRLRDELDEARRIGADVARQRAELLRQNERSAPAVPDGEDATAVCPVCGRTAALVLDAHGHFGPDVEAEDEVVCDVSHWRLSWAAEKAAGGRPDTRSSLPVVDGEDVPARLEAAADACEALGWTGTANTFRDLASQLREWDEETPEVRAAVAAALARPTGHQQ